MPVRYYSAGMVVRLAFSIATAIEPEILLIDEVLSVGDMAFQNKARYAMMEMTMAGAQLRGCGPPRPRNRSRNCVRTASRLDHAPHGHDYLHRLGDRMPTRRRSPHESASLSVRCVSGLSPPAVTTVSFNDECTWLCSALSMTNGLGRPLRLLGKMLRKHLPTADAYGESWGTGDHVSHRSTPILDAAAGVRVADLMEARAGGILLGRSANTYATPSRLVKLLDACDWLSVQVHPRRRGACCVLSPERG